MCVSTTGRWFDDTTVVHADLCVYMCVHALALLPASGRLTDLRSNRAWSMLLSFEETSS